MTRKTLKSSKPFADWVTGLTDMNLWKNPELRLEIILHIVLTAVLAAVGFCFGAVSGIMLLVSGMLFTVIYLVSVYRRYRSIARLSQNIDRILHGQDSILFSESREGELAILGSEIQKMTVRLRDQADILVSDKQRLNDAIADIAHQLRTPLTSMTLTISLLSDEKLTEERRAELMRELKKSLRRIDWLIEALLKISKIDAGTAEFKSELVSVHELISRAAAPFLIPMELREQQLKVHAEGESYIGDMLWSIEAIGNILKNCVEHTPPGGTIEIAAEETPLYTQIIVSDSGSGFATEDIPHLFDRFYKGKNAGEQSVGIGLSLARTIIAEQNGTISASNGKNGGACFTVRFYKSVI